MTTRPIDVVQRENARLHIENRQLKEEVRNLRAFVNMLNDLHHAGERVTDDTQLLPLLRRILRQAMKLLDAPDGSLLLLDEETNELVFVVVYGIMEDQLINYRIPADEGIAGWVIRNRRSTLVPNVRVDMRFYHQIDEEFKFNTQSIAAAPLIGDRHVYGVIEALNRPGDKPFTEEDVALLELLCRAAGELLADIANNRNPMLAPEKANGH
ncbi:MAG: GAF domain-containing protein [Chloroflexi bacterium]|nr:MAG: GAF domain-containing protein [Chloroflexota bacterium]